MTMQKYWYTSERSLSMNRESLEAGVLFSYGIGKGLVKEILHPRDKIELMESIGVGIGILALAAGAVAIHKSLTSVQNEQDLL